jgi:hypothetical protein
MGVIQMMNLRLEFLDPLSIMGTRQFESRRPSNRSSDKTFKKYQNEPNPGKTRIKEDPHPLAITNGIDSASRDWNARTGSAIGLRRIA